MDLGTIIVWILLGLAAGAVAKLIMPGKDPGGLIVTILLGIVGAILGGFLGGLLGIAGGGIVSFILAVIGAIILLVIYRVVTKRKVG